MDRDTILEIIRQKLNELQGMGVRALLLFGPAARNEHSNPLETNLLLELEPPHTFEHFLEVKTYLERLLGHPVELVMENPNHPEIRPYIEEDAIRIL